MSKCPPKMRRLLAAQTKIDAIVTGVLAITAGALCKVFYVDARQKRMQEYYRNFDGEASVRTMSEYLQSSGFKRV